MLLLLNKCASIGSSYFYFYFIFFYIVNSYLVKLLSVNVNIYICIILWLLCIYCGYYVYNNKCAQGIRTKTVN